MIRALSQRKGVDLMSAPQPTTRLGQEAKAEVARKFDYTDEAGKRLHRETQCRSTVLAKMKGEIGSDFIYPLRSWTGMGLLTTRAGAEPTFSVSQGEMVW